VVLVPVGQDDSPKCGACLKRLEIGDDAVDPGEVAVGEHHPGIDQEPAVAPLDQHAVETEFAQASKWDESDGIPQLR
jgi:hypothetical protein